MDCINGFNASRSQLIALYHKIVRQNIQFIFTGRRIVMWHNEKQECNTGKRLIQMAVIAILRSLHLTNKAAFDS